jgi:hypothetical protein
VKKYIIPVFAFIIMVLLISSSGVYASTPGYDGIQVHLNSTPSLQINVSKAEFLSFDFTAIVLLINESLQFPGMETGTQYIKVPYYMAFSNNTWNISKFPDGNISYSLAATFNPFHSMDINGTVFNNSTFNISTGHNFFFEFQPFASINAKVYVNISQYKSNYNLIAVNSSYPANNISLDNSTIEISFSIVFGNAIDHGGRLILIERLRGVSNGTGLHQTGFQGSMKDNNRQKFSGLALGSSVSLNNPVFLYWWPQNYTINGNENTNVLNFSPLRDIKDGSLLIYSFNLPNDTKSVSQDPYITVPGSSIGPGSFVFYQKQIVNILIVHSELIALGLLAGIVFIALPYAVYRRRKLS